MTRIAIAGGTGLVGRYAKEAVMPKKHCAAPGHETVTLARATGVDLLAGAGLADARRRPGQEPGQVRASMARVSGPLP
jgi:uncharacterized protein YbjT (DUF2867 family)